MEDFRDGVLESENEVGSALDIANRAIPFVVCRVLSVAGEMKQAKHFTLA